MKAIFITQRNIKLFSKSPNTENTLYVCRLDVTDSLSLKATKLRFM